MQLQPPSFGLNSAGLSQTMKAAHKLELGALPMKPKLRPKGK
jgi:hypothetical protein